MRRGLDGQRRGATLFVSLLAVPGTVGPGRAASPYLGKLPPAEAVGIAELGIAPQEGCLARRADVLTAIGGIGEALVEGAGSGFRSPRDQSGGGQEQREAETGDLFHGAKLL